MDKRIDILDARLENFGKQVDALMDGNLQLVKVVNTMLKSQDNLLTNVIPIMQKVVDSQTPVTAAVPKCKECVGLVTPSPKNNLWRRINTK